jgi:hypothetical protein
MDRSGTLGRALAVLAVVSLAAMAVSPAFSAANFTKAKVKRVAQKVLRNGIDDVGNPIFVEEAGEFVRFGPVKMSVGQPDVPLFSLGPFTIEGACFESGGDTHAVATITTVEENSTFGSVQFPSGVEFDPSDGPLFWAHAISNGAEAGTSSMGSGHAESPSGTALDGSVNAIAELGGQDCTFYGWYTNLNA